MTDQVDCQSLAIEHTLIPRPPAATVSKVRRQYTVIAWYSRRAKHAWVRHDLKSADALLERSEWRWVIFPVMISDRERHAGCHRSRFDMTGPVDIPRFTPHFMKRFLRVYNYPLANDVQHHDGQTDSHITKPRPEPAR